MVLRFANIFQRGLEDIGKPNLNCDYSKIKVNPNSRNIW